MKPNIVPGSLAGRVAITPTCRENRGSKDAFDEAADRLRETYRQSEGAVENEAVTWHLVLVRAEPGEEA